jgi:hypothetical protein
MIDRHGKPIRLSWAPHELEWVIAASALPRNERLAAYRDISDMTGRSIKAVSNRAGFIKAQERQKAREWLAVHLRKTRASGGFPEAPRRVFVQTPTVASPARIRPSNDSEPLRCKGVGT